VTVRIDNPDGSGFETAIIGCGLIGTSWAALFSAHGHKVRLWDVADGWQDRVCSHVASARDQLSRLGMRGAGEIILSSSLQDAVRGARWIQECTPESIDLKHRVFGQIAAAATSEAIVASSTSSLTWSQLAPFVNDPTRLITAHPFSPPHLMPLVEVFASNERVGALALAFYRGLKRRPLLLRRDVPGHVANRLASALWREAVHMVAAGIADVESIDAAVVDGPGLRWATVGPHMAYHLGGGSGGIQAYLQHLGQSQVRRWADLGSPTLTTELREALVCGVEREAAGRSIPLLVRERDDLLIAILRAREAPSQREE
jgi:carnitine 3-dehydrogenase